MANSEHDRLMIALKITTAEDLEAQARRLRQQADELIRRHGLMVIRPELQIVQVVTT